MPKNQRLVSALDGSDSHPVDPGDGLFGRYPIRGRWFKETRYVGLRNAAWIVRNSRQGQGNNPLALKVVVAEAGRLLEAGEPLSDVVEALCELLVHP